MHILTHSHNLTRVSCNDLLLESDERPLLPFGFDSLYYEPPTGLAFKVLAGEQIPLSADEITACQTYCDTFLETADYPVFAYDDSGVFVGSMPKTEALTKQLAYSFPFGPDHPASRWNGEVWEKIKASILDDGTLIIDPAHICERCAITLTADEWAAFPSVPASDSEAVWRWDFVQENWKDVADPLVFAFDEADAYIGQHKRSLAQQRGWGWHVSPPEGWPYKNTPQGWQRVEAVISEDGYCDIRPVNISDDVILLFTREEWAKFPTRPKAENGEIWAWDFVQENWKDISNMYGAAFEADGDRAGVFAGHMPRLEAKKEGLGWTRDLPGGPAAKLDGTAWVPVFVVIMDDGTPRFRPESVCDRCMLAMTEAEWNAFPQPPVTPEALGSWSWNFVSEKWEDMRNPAELRRTARGMVHGRLWYTCGRRLTDVWPDIAELTMAIAEMSQDATPYLDAYSAQSGEDRETVKRRILSAHAAAGAILGRMAAQRDTIFSSINEAPDNATVDAVFTQFLAVPEDVSCLSA